MKCPRCEKALTILNASKIDAFEMPDEKHPALAYLCPHCEAILGVVMDPEHIASWVPKA